MLFLPIINFFSIFHESAEQALHYFLQAEQAQNSADVPVARAGPPTNSRWPPGAPAVETRNSVQEGLYLLYKFIFFLEATWPN